MIACIVCGGVGEVMLVMAGFTWLLNWLRKRHDRKKCKCCQQHDPVEGNVTKSTLTQEQKEFLDGKI